MMMLGGRSKSLGTTFLALWRNNNCCNHSVSSSALFLSAANSIRFQHSYSLEVLPQTAAKLESIETKNFLPSRVYIAHLETTPIQDMVQTAAFLRERIGIKEIMPHVPARLVQDRAMLRDWIRRYKESANVDQFLLIAGSSKTPFGAFENSLELIETGLFNECSRIHFAAHPQGNGLSWEDEIDNLRAKQAVLSEMKIPNVALVTQFAFDSKDIIDWTVKIQGEGIELPVHVGVAGPTSVSSLLKYARICGVQPSATFLQRRGLTDISNLVSYDPLELVKDLKKFRDENNSSSMEQIHFFPFGGVEATIDFARKHAQLF